MPLGASRLAFLSKTAEAVAADRTAASFTNNGAEIDTAQSQFGGSSMTFPAFGDTLYVDRSDLYDFGTDDFTIEFWVRVNGDSSATYFNAQTSDFNNGWLISNFGTQLRIQFYNSGSATTVFSPSSIDFTDGSWHHCAIVRNSGTVTFYMDGTAGTGVSYSTAVNTLTNGDSHNLTIGYAFEQGYIDEIRFSTTARYTSSFTSPTSAFTNDADTLLLVHADGADGKTWFRDDNGLVYDERTTNSTFAHSGSSTVTGKFSNALRVSGSAGNGNYMRFNFGQVDSNQVTWGGNHATTIEFWMYYSAAGGVTLATTKTSSLTSDVYENANEFIILDETGGGTLKAGWTSSGAGQLRSLGSGLEGAWHHYVLQQDGTQFTYWVDGTQKQNFTYSSAPSNDQMLWGIFKYFSGGVSCDVRIDDVRITNDRLYTPGSSITVPTEELANTHRTVGLFHCESTSQTDDNSTGVSTREITLSATNFDKSVPDGISVQNTSYTNDPTTITIIALFRPTDLSARQSLLSISSANNVLMQASFINTNGTMRQYNILTSDTNDQTTTNTFSANTWHQYVVSIDVGNGTINGLLDGTALTFGGSTYSSRAFNFAGSATDIGLGHFLAGGGANYNLNGDMAYIYLAETYVDWTSSTNKDKVWDSTNSRARWLGTSGTSTGLATPTIYHYGNTSTIQTNQGSESYTMSDSTMTGNGSDTTGPTVTG